MVRIIVFYMNKYEESCFALRVKFKTHYGSLIILFNPGSIVFKPRYCFIFSILFSKYGLFLIFVLPGFLIEQ